LAKSNPQQRTMLRTQRRVGMPPQLERIRQAASRDRKMRFTALFHHVYRLDTLRRAYLGLNPKAAPGVDGVGQVALVFPEKRCKQIVLFVCV
jgi:hypothetical protein